MRRTVPSKAAQDSLEVWKEYVDDVNKRNKKKRKEGSKKASKKERNKERYGAPH